jgi:symplekin
MSLPDPVAAVAEASGAEQVVELLNAAQLAASADSTKLDNLRKVQEIIVNREPDLLDNFMDEVLAFQTDRSQDVRKFVVGFIEDACKKDMELLAKVVVNLQRMLEDQAVAVQKRVIQAMTHLYRATLRFLTEAKAVSERMEAAWVLMCNIKEVIVHLLDSDNDGMRTMTVKFMESVVLIQTHREPESVAKENDFCLDHVPLGLKLARPRRLEEEATRIFDEMVKYHGSAHISSANLMTCMGSLTTIAKLRPVFMARVITALEMLQANLPPTLAKSQVSSVRKHLKNQLLQLLRHPTAAEHFFTNMTTLLTDLGAGRDEVMRNMPQYEEMKRRAKKKEREAAKAREVEESTVAKRPKIDIPDEEASDDDDGADDPIVKPVKTPMTESAVDITEKFIQSRLSDHRFATELVLASMSLLPTVMPPHFNNTFTPIAAAGTDGQVRAGPL